MYARNTAYEDEGLALERDIRSKEWVVMRLDGWVTSRVGIKHNAWAMELVEVAAGERACINLLHVRGAAQRGI